MKTIKYILSIFAVIFISTASAQIHEFENAPFVGIWKYQSGNQIYRLTIWEHDEASPYDGRYYLLGHYEMVQINNGIESIVYTSNPSEIPVGQKFPYVFMGTVDEGVLNGTLHELHNGGSGLNGYFTITQLYPSPCTGCTPTITFSITKMKGVRAKHIGDTSPDEFVIPNNIQLVKQL
ncbi:MAG: DUF6705 family protein [Flavobacterium sp.]